MNRAIFILALELGDIRFYSTYKYLMKSQWTPLSEQYTNQEKQLRIMIRYVYENIPYYRTLFKENRINPDSIRKISDLKKIPTLDKKTIQNHWQDFVPVNGLNRIRYHNSCTGGSSGTPLHYRLSVFDRFISGAMLYRGWSYAEYNLESLMSPDDNSTNLI